MRYFDRNRRRLTKKHFVRGTLTKSSGENEVTIENSAGLPFEGITISGTTHQNEYSGINLFDQELLVSNNRFIKSTYNGIECLRCSSDGLTYIPFEAPAGTYKFSFDIAHPSGYDCYSYITLEDGSKKVILVYGTVDTSLSEFTRKTNTITATSKIVKIEIGIWNIVAKPIYIKDVMLCTGDETVYEPYVGGKYSPNPDFPQPIESINSYSLPSEYQQVEYIESTGTQIIDTGFIPTNNTKVLLDMKMSNLVANGTGLGNAICGCYDTPNVFSINFGASTEQTTEFFIWVNNTLSSGGTYTKLNVYSAVNSRNVFSLTNTFVSYSTFGTTLTKGSWTSLTKSLRMFGNLNSSGVERPFERYHMILYGAKIYDNGILARNFVPCYRKSDNEIGLYDLANNTFYTNNGTGEFIKGADVNAGMNVVLHGDNLFNQEEILTDADFTKAEYNGVECIKLKPLKVNHIFPCFIPKGTYTLTLEYLGVYGCNMTVMFIYEDGTTQWYGDFIKNTPMTEFLSRTRTLTATKNIVSIDIRSFSIVIKSEYYLKNIMVNVGEPKPYEPYFREEIAIPSIVEVGGVTVPISMAGTAELSDVISVDASIKQVGYKHAIATYEMTGEEALINANFPNQPLATFHLKDAPVVNPRLNNLGLCNVAVPDDEWKPDRCMFEVYPLNYEGHSTGVMLYFPGCASIDEMRNIIRQKYAEGNPIKLQYPAYYARKYDVTNTDFGQALLNLVVPRTQSGVLRVESALPASGLEVEYYSMEKEDKVTLEVLCLSEDGEELKRTSHSVRKDSKYQVKAPLIDGYTPINESIFGVASKDAEIIFEYKENEDATV